MSKAVKAMVTEELKSRYQGVESACVVDLTGLDVKQQDQLRRNLREKSATMQVVKNSMVKRAFVGGPLGPLVDALEGPSAIITSTDSLIDVAKMLVDATKQFENLSLKQALVDGEPELLTVEMLAKMKSRLELLGDIAGLVTAPARTIAGCLTAPQSRIAGCLKTLADKAA